MSRVDHISWLSKLSWCHLQFDLWDENAQLVQRSVLPLMNRVLVFRVVFAVLMTYSGGACDVPKEVSKGVSWELPCARQTNVEIYFIRPICHVWEDRHPISTFPSRYDILITLLTGNTHLYTHTHKHKQRHKHKHTHIHTNKTDTHTTPHTQRPT